MKKTLTKQQREFTKLYAEGLSASKAYKQAYNTEGQTEKNIAYKASKLLSKEEIKKEIQEKENKNSSFLNYTAEKSFNKIKEIQTLCLEKKDFTNALKAEEMAGKLAGLFKQNDGAQVGILGDFKEFYAAICAKKDYGTQENTLSQSKNVDLSSCPENQVIETKQN